MGRIPTRNRTCVSILLHSYITPFFCWSQWIQEALQEECRILLGPPELKLLDERKKTWMPSKGTSLGRPTGWCVRHNFITPRSGCVFFSDIQSHMLALRLCFFTLAMDLISLIPIKCGLESFANWVHNLVLSPAARASMRNVQIRNLSGNKWILGFQIFYLKTSNCICEINFIKCIYEIVGNQF